MKLFSPLWRPAHPAWLTAFLEVLEKAGSVTRALAEATLNLLTRIAVCSFSSRRTFHVCASIKDVTLGLILAMVGSGLACGGGQSPPPIQNGPIVRPVVTTGDQTKLLQSQPTVQFSSGGQASSLIITVDQGTTYQLIDGFGASLTDSSAWVIWNNLDSSQQAALMQSLFSPTSGIGISFLRQPMGASDFSASGNYSYDNVPAGQTDPNLVNFTISHDTAYIVPLLKQAMAVNPAIKLVGVPWSPPAWMKTTATMNGGNMIASYFPSLAQYFVQYVQAYQHQGIPIYALAVQNEPLNSNSNYPTEYLAASDESDFIANDLGLRWQAPGWAASSSSVTSTTGTIRAMPSRY